MPAFNPWEPQFQNSTRPSQGREKDFLQLSVSSIFSAESPTPVKVSGRVFGQLGTSCSLSKAASQAEVNERCTDWTLAVAFSSGRAQMVWCPFISPQEPSAAQHLFQIPHFGKIIKAQHWDTSVLGRRAGTSTMSPTTPGCHLKFNTTQRRSTCPSYWWSGTAQGAEQQTQIYPKLHLAVLHARHSPTKPHV